MNKYLRSASERFDQLKKKDYLINPISEVDTEIIVEIGQILKKAGLNDILEIILSYKEQKDEDIKDQLMQWNIDHPYGVEKDLTNKLKDAIDQVVEQESRPPFIQIGELTLKIYDLHGFELLDKLDKEGSEKWIIKINPTPEHAKSIPLYSNYEVEFFDEQNRNQVLQELRNVLSEQGTDFIDLNSKRDE